MALKDLISEYRVVEVGSYETENLPKDCDADMDANCLFVRSYIVELDFADLEKAAQHFPFLATYTAESGGLCVDTGDISGKIMNFMTG